MPGEVVCPKGIHSKENDVGRVWSHISSNRTVKFRTLWLTSPTGFGADVKSIPAYYRNPNIYTDGRAETNHWMTGPTRRRVLALSAGATVTLAGCAYRTETTDRDSSVNADTPTDSEAPADDEGEDNRDVLEERLVIKSGTRHTIPAESEQSHRVVEIHEGGELQFEPSATLQLSG